MGVVLAFQVSLVVRIGVSIYTLLALSCFLVLLLAVMFLIDQVPAGTCARGEMGELVIGPAAATAPPVLSALRTASNIGIAHINPTATHILAPASRSQRASYVRP